MIIKTTKSSILPIKELVPKIHGYDLPEIIFCKVLEGNQGYLDWIVSSCKRDKKTNN